jgi:hypothetical protein
MRIHHGIISICSSVVDETYLEEVLQSWDASRQQGELGYQLGWQPQLAQALPTMVPASKVLPWLLLQRALVLIVLQRAQIMVKRIPSNRNSTIAS